MSVAAVDPDDWDQLFPGRFWKAGLLDGKELTLTIAKAVTEQLPAKRGGEETKGVLVFSDHKLQLALNKTNGLCLREMFGRKLSNWQGKRVTLFPTETKMWVEKTQRVEMVPCIRFAGSPDLAADMTVVIDLPRKTSFSMVLRRTGPKPAARQQTQQKPAVVPLPEAEVLALLERINACGDPALLHDLKSEAKRHWPRLVEEARLAVTGAIEGATGRVEVGPA